MILIITQVWKQLLSPLSFLYLPLQTLELTYVSYEHFVPLLVYLIIYLVSGEVFICLNIFTQKFNVRLPNLIQLQNYCIRASFLNNVSKHGNSHLLSTYQWYARFSYCLGSEALISLQLPLSMWQKYQYFLVCIQALQVVKMLSVSSLRIYQSAGFSVKFLKLLFNPYVSKGIFHFPF